MNKLIMKIKINSIIYSLLIIAFLFTSCYNQERNCKDFKTGKFKSEIEVDGKTYKCILKDLQFHPVTDNLLHLDFMELVDGQVVRVEIPVHYSNSPNSGLDCSL